jgi:hypothetical protein
LTGLGELIISYLVLKNGNFLLEKTLATDVYGFPAKFSLTEKNKK